MPAWAWFLAGVGATVVVEAVVFWVVSMWALADAVAELSVCEDD